MGLLYDCEIFADRCILDYRNISPLPNLDHVDTVSAQPQVGPLVAAVSGPVSVVANYRLLNFCLLSSDRN